MSLKLLVLEDEPELEISYVPLSTEGDVEPDPELPGEFLMQDDLDLLDDAATALESIGMHIACEGMDLSTARELEKLSPGFMRRNGGHGSFTHRPSLEGLADAAKAVKDKFFEIIRKVREYVATMYKRFKAWLVAKFSKAENQDVEQEINDFLVERRNRDAMQYMSNLPETPDKVADEIARFMDGETQAFASALTDQLQSMMKRIMALEEMMQANPTHFRLAKGIVTVQELFKEDANSSLNAMLKASVKVADNAMRCRTGDQFMGAMEEIAAMTAKLDEFEKNMVVNNESSDQYGDDRAISMDKLFDNIQTVADDMKKVSIQQQVKDMVGSVEDIIRISEETKIEEILEMIPEDVPEDKRSALAQKIATFYRRIAKFGGCVLRLWKVRANAIESINRVGKALLDLVEGFEKAVVSAGTSLTPEQKTQLAKALAGKGFSIVF